MKILVVTTSNDRFGPEGHPTGVWFEEFADPYMEFLAAGAQMIVASPKGGPMPIDPRTTPNDEQRTAWAPAIAASSSTVPLQSVRADEFDALFLPGGHGPMFDLPDDQAMQRLVREFHEQGKLIGAVCHGPAGIVNARGADGEYLVKNVTLTAYTYPEEVAAKLDTKVPFILENKLREHGANFIQREPRADHVERDGLFLTGQNPWSSQSIARCMSAALKRQLPPLVNTVKDGVYDVQTMAEFPPGTFLENLAISAQCKVAVSSLEEGAIYCVPFDDKPFVRGQLPMPAGLLWLDEDSLLAASNAGEKSGLFVIRNGGENPKMVIPIPEAGLLNGLMHLDGTRYLVADSYRSQIWVADISTGSVRMWLQHPGLAHAADPFHPVPQFPGVNGIRRFGDTLYASSTEQQKLIAIAIRADGSPGDVRVHQTLINLDDFAFDTEGGLYGATHVYNSVVRISPDRKVTVLAGLEQGLAGSTAVAFGRTPQHANVIFVTTNGGMSAPPPGGVQPARILRIRVNAKGYFPGTV